MSAASPEALPPAVEGEDHVVEGRAGRLVVRVAGQGAPVLLLHSINAAASAAEMAPVHAHLAATHRVWTPDLPGFGRSQRGARDYSPRLYTDAVHDLLEAIAAVHGPVPVHALALSLSSEFLARAAAEAPERFASLAFVAATGFDGRSARRPPQTGTREIGWLRRLVGVPAVGRGAFRLLTRPGVIRYFLQRTFGRDAIDETLWAYCCRSVAVEGARHAPLAFLSGSLFSRDATALYDAVTAPAWLAHGTRGDFQDYRGADRVARRPNWSVESFPTGALPWFEVPEAFGASLDGFLERAAPGVPAPE